MQVGSDEKPVRVYYPKAGTFKVTLTISRYDRSVSTVEYGYITVYPNLTADFAASSTYINAGQSVTFTNNSEGNVTAYKWTFPGGTPSTSTEANPVIVYNTPGYYDATLQVWSGVQSKIKDKYSYIIVANKMVANFTVSKTSINTGESINFTSLSAGIPQQYSWTFQGGTPANSTQANPTNIKYNIPGLYRVSLTVTNGGDVDTKTAENYITVLSSLKADFTASKTELIVGESTNFTNTSSGTPTSSLWTFEGGTPANSTQANPTNIKYDAPGLYRVSLTVTNGGNVDTKTAENYITVLSLLTADFTASKTELIVGESTNFTNTSSGTPTSSLWTFEGATTATSNSVNPSNITYQTAGAYDVSLFISKGSVTKSILKNDFITVYPLIEPNFSVDRAEIIVGETVFFQNLTKGGAVTYQWTLPGTDKEIILLEQPGGIKYKKPGEYDVTLKASGNIQSKEVVKTKFIKVAEITGIDDPQGSTIAVYPNPTHGKFKVNGVSGKYSIDLYNLIGQKVYSATDVLSEIEVELPPGVYVLRVDTDGTNHFLKVVVNE
jgi:PKD repeat protein